MDGSAVLDLTDEVEVAWLQTVADQTIRATLDLERLRARTWIREYADAVKRGSRRR